MSLTTYKLTSNRLRGFINITFENGTFKAFETEFKGGLNETAFEAFRQELVFSEADVYNFETIGLSVAKMAATNEKIAMFCRAYEHHVKIKYKVSAADSGKIKLITLTEPMIEHYFTSDNFLFRNKYSISNLVKYYNELNAELINGQASKFPNGWSKQFADKLKPEQLPEYWSHLRTQGLEPKKIQGVTVDWVPVAGNQ